MNRNYRLTRRGTIEIAPGWEISTRSNAYRRLVGLPPKKKTTKPPTEKQLAQRLKLKMAVQLANKFSEILATTKKISRKRCLPQAKVVKNLMTKGIEGVYPNFTIDYSKIALSNGYLHGLWYFQPYLSTSGRLTVKLIPRPADGWFDHTDSIILCVYNIETNTSYMLEQKTSCTDTEICMQFPSYNKDYLYHLWVVEASSKDRELGHTQYFRLMNK